MRVLRQCLRFALYLQHPASISYARIKYGTLLRLFKEPVEGIKDVPNGVARSKTDPLWYGPVLLLGFGQLLLRAEGFVGLFNERYHHSSMVED